MERSMVEGQDGPRARGAVGCLALAMLLASLGVSIPNVALPTLAEAFAADFHAVQWVVIAYLLATTVAIVGAGRLGDIVGSRKALIGGLVLFGAATLMCAAAPSLWMLVAARAAQGTGAAVLMALSVALVRRAVPAERTGRAMGLLGSMSAIGTALGPSLGGILIAGPGWRVMFWVMVPLGVLALGLAYRHLPRDAGLPRDARTRFDGPGMVLLGLTLAAYALAVTSGGGAFVPGPLLLLAALVGAGLFVFVERRSAAPLVEPAMFRSGSLRASLAMNALVATVMMTTLVVGPFYLSGTLGLDAARVGLIMSVGPAISALSGVPAGRLVDRAGAPAATVAGLAAAVAGAVGMAALPPVFGVGGYVAAIAVLTPGYQLFLAANNTAVMTGADPGRRGVISGLLNLSRNLGLFTGASVMGAVFSLAAGAGDVAAASGDALAAGLRATFLVAAGLLAVALALGLGRGFPLRP